MPTDQDYNIFRRYIGDYDTATVSEETIDEYLDDATIQATAVHITPDQPAVTLYDSLQARYSPEVILLAAINWWWNRAAYFSNRITTTVGQASEQASERWQHAMNIIGALQDLYDQTKVLGQDPDMANLSHWNRNTLSRIGGQREEDAVKAILPGITYA